MKVIPPYMFPAEENWSATPKDWRAWPTHALFNQSRRYFWEGVGPLSVKSFRGGAARYRVGGGGRYAADDSVFLILNGGQSYSIEIESPTPIESFCVFFRPGVAEAARRDVSAGLGELLDEPFRDAPAVPFVERTYPHEFGDKRGVSDALFRLRDAVARDPERDALYLAERMQEIATALVVGQSVEAARIRRFGEDAAIVRPAARDELYRRLHLAHDYLAACYDESLTLDVLASVACLSTNHLLRTYRAAFGVTPHQSLTARRLEIARRLLRQTDVSVTEICLRVGFQSLGSFSRLFSRHVGVSPDAYRRHLRVRRRYVRPHP